MKTQRQYIGDYVAKNYIDFLMKSAEYKVFHKVFDKLTIVVAKMPNGFTIVASSGSVNPDNYCPDTGEESCKEQIRNELWKLEGYSLQDRIHYRTPMK